MDSGLGIGGLSSGKDELASSQFDVFENVEVETGVKRMYTLTFTQYHHHLVKVLLLLSYLLILKNLLMLNPFVYMVVCEL